MQVAYDSSVAFFAGCHIRRTNEKRLSVLCVANTVVVRRLFGQYDEHL